MPPLEGISLPPGGQLEQKTGSEAKEGYSCREANNCRLRRMSSSATRRPQERKSDRIFACQIVRVTD